jgi:hypothetical protein
MSRKQTFPCGHTGKGRFCHHCATEKREPGGGADEPSGIRSASASGSANVLGSASASGSASAASSSSSAIQLDKAELEKIDKETWRETFEADPIPLRHLPSKGLVQRARLILGEIQKGAPWHQFNGKRLQHDRTIVSVPLGRRYRILFRTDEGAPRPVEVLSHESYNGTKPGRR